MAACMRLVKPCSPGSPFLPITTLPSLLSIFWQVSIFLHSLPSGFMARQPYPYTTQLTALSQCISRKAQPLPEGLEQITTPLQLPFWRKHLSQHPDQQFATLVLQGIEYGFKVGFQWGSHTLHSKQSNMVLAKAHPSVVTEYLEQEVKQGRIARLPSMEFAKEMQLHISPFGVIPKKNKPGKWRLILDLSSPEGHSVNDGISKDLCSLSYVSIDDAVTGILQVGRGALMAKMDIKEAYRNIPVFPQDRLLLG